MKYAFGHSDSTKIHKYLDMILQFQGSSKHGSKLKIKRPLPPSIRRLEQPLKTAMTFLSEIIKKKAKQVGTRGPIASVWRSRVRRAISPPFWAERQDPITCCYYQHGSPITMQK